jgi:hypothetical protein
MGNPFEGLGARCYRKSVAGDHKVADGKLGGVAE